MLYEHFQVNRSVGTGHSRPNDVKRIRRALHETGYNASPPNPSGRYDASASDAIERFQRDFGLKPDGIVLPGGPTERALDLTLAARREGGPAAQSRLRDVFRTFADADLTFRPAEPDDERPGRFVDRDGESASSDQLRTLLKSNPATKPIVLAMMDQREFHRKPWENIVDAGRGGGPAAGAAALRAISETLRQLLRGGQDEPAPSERKTQPAAPPPVLSPQPSVSPPGPRQNLERADRGGKSAPAKRTEAIDIDTGIPPSPADPPRGFDQDPENVPAVPTGPTILPGPEIQEARPGIFVFLNLQGALDDLMILEWRRGNEKTRHHLEEVRDLFVKVHGLKHIAGGRKVGEDGTIKEEPETWIPGPQKAFQKEGERIDGRKGGKFVDLTFEDPRTGRIVHVQTVDVDRNGKPTQRELDNAEVIRRATNADVILIPKPQSKARR